MHPESYYRDQGDIILDRDIVRLELMPEFSKDVIELVFQFTALNDHGERVDTRRYVIEVDMLVLNDRQSSSYKTDLLVHHVLVYRDNGEPLLACDAADDLRALVISAFAYDGSRFLRRIGISDIDRDIRHSGRENSILMKYAGAHI